MKDGVIFKLVPRSLPPVTCAVDADTMKAANCEKRGQGQENKIRFSFLVKLLLLFTLLLFVFNCRQACCFSFRTKLSQSIQPRDGDSLHIV